MPLYEYVCNACGRTVEQLRSYDNPLIHCPTCNGLVRRVYGPVLVKFKSSSWRPYGVDSSEGEESIQEELAIG